MPAMGWIGMIPTFASFAGLISGGVLSDTLLRSGFSSRFARAQGPALCLAAAVPFLIAAALVPWASVSIACLTLYLFLANAAGGLPIVRYKLLAVHLDLLEISVPKNNDCKVHPVQPKKHQ